MNRALWVSCGEDCYLTETRVGPPSFRRDTKSTTLLGAVPIDVLDQFQVSGKVSKRPKIFSLWRWDSPLETVKTSVSSMILVWSPSLKNHFSLLFSWDIDTNGSVADHWGRMRRKLRFRGALPADLRDHKADLPGVLNACTPSSLLHNTRTWLKGQNYIFTVKSFSNFFNNGGCRSKCTKVI